MSEKIIIGLFIAFIIISLVLTRKSDSVESESEYEYESESLKSYHWTIEQLVALDQLLHYMLGTNPASPANQGFYTWMTTHISQQLSFKELVSQTISDRLDTITYFMIKSNYLGTRGNWNHDFKQTQIDAMKLHIFDREETCYSCIFDHIESMYDPTEYIQGHAKDMIEQLYPICETC